MIRLVPRRLINLLCLPILVLLAVVLCATSSAHAADIGHGWGEWWLPPVRSTHGGQIDLLFLWTFWITMIVFVVVEILLVYFLIKYRHSADRSKAHFTHGNTRLEMCWTLAPAVIFIALAVANKGVWENLRFNPAMDKAETAQLLVIGQQFKWNVIYPGPDGKLGRYLVFPKPTDLRWPGGKKFAGVDGPAFLPYEKAIAQINRYIDQENPLGKVTDDPAGKDDNMGTVGRPIYIPVDRAVEVQLSSKDVIHDFFLPNFRVKLDAVPGLRGKLVFTATMTSKQHKEATLREYTLDELAYEFKRDPRADLKFRITEKSEGATKDPATNTYAYMQGKDIIAKDDGDVSPDTIEKLRAAGIKKVQASESGKWELVCEELCGAQHTLMRNDLYVLDQAEYSAKFEGKKTTPTPPPAGKPVASAQK